MRNFEEFLKEELENDAELRKEYEELEIEYQLKKALIAIRKDKNITQKELAAITGIHQSDISKIENGNANPSLRTLRKLASGLGMTLKIEFVPLKEAKA